MKLVDTSVWIDHFQRPNQSLIELLDSESLLCHPFIVGELACGTFRNREEVLPTLRRLPFAPEIDHAHVLTLVERHRLMGSGIGWIDAHLLASSLVLGCALFTLDQPLKAAAKKLGIAE